MRTSPFAPSRTALLLLPFFVIPAVVIFGTPRVSTLEPDRPAGLNSAQAKALETTTAGTSSLAETPSRRTPAPGVPLANHAANRSQSLRGSTVTKEWSAVRSTRPAASNRVRANPGEIVGNLAVGQTSADPSGLSAGGFESSHGGNGSSHEFGLDRPRPIRRSPRVRLGAPTALPPVMEDAVTRNEPSGSQSRSQKTPASVMPMSDDSEIAVEDEFPFPLGTSVSLVDTGRSRATGSTDSSRRSFGGRKPRAQPAAVGKVAPSTGTVIHRAQEPDPPDAVQSTTRAAITWKEAQQRLQTLGASRYRLETWGDHGQFRFTCSVPLKSNSPINRHFEAKASDPMVAVARVLDEIEHWRQSH